MSQRQKEWARRVRAKLIVAMGGKCVNCDEVDDLCFDHPYGRTWNHRQRDTSARMCLIRREYERGEVRLLCRTCNSCIRPRRQASRPMMDEPF